MTTCLSGFINFLQCKEKMQEKEGEKLSLHKKHAQKAQNYEIKFNSILGLFPDICLPLS